MRRFLVLVIDDDERIRNFLRSKLKASGYDVRTVGDGLKGIEQAHAHAPDVIVLDLLMPGMDGLEVLRELRGFSSVPVIVLTAKGEGADRIRGLRLGADDYLPKPFNPDELVARIEAVRRRMTRRGRQEGPGRFSAGEVEIDFRRRSARVRGEEKYLTRIEWLLLRELTRNVGRLMPYEALLTSVWGPEYRDDIQLLRTWVSRLRMKLETGPDAPALIRTLPKAGYMIDDTTS